MRLFREPLLFDRDRAIPTTHSPSCCLAITPTFCAHCQHPCADSATLPDPDLILTLTSSSTPSTTTIRRSNPLPNPLLGAAVEAEAMTLTLTSVSVLRAPPTSTPRGDSRR